MSRRILQKADEIIHGHRKSEYGHAEDSFQIVAEFWNSYLGTDLLPEDVAIMMCLFKIARQQHGHKEDNLVDMCGYAALAQRCVDVRMEDEKNNAKIF